MRKLILSAIIIGFVAIVSCKKDELAKELKLDKTSVELFVGKTEAVKVLSGNGNYKVKPNENVTATVSGTMITVKGIKAGSSDMFVTDSAGKTLSVKVTVKENIKDVTVKAGTTTAKEGEKVEVEITAGSGEYTVATADAKVATAEVKDGKVVITAVKAGETKVTVTDTKTKKTAEVTITVSETIADVAVKGGTPTVKEGEEVEVEITAGSGEYTVATGDDKVATAVVKDGKVVITAVKAGETKVTITDTKTKKTAEVTVTVSETVADVAVKVANPTVKEGEKAEVEITAGSGEYTATSADDKVATAEVKDGKVVITAVKAGTTKVTITDEKTKKTVEVSVTVNEKEVAVADVAVKEATATVKEGEKVEVEITAGSGEYTVATADEQMATATIKDGKVVITGVKAGEVKVTITDTKTEKTAEVVVTVTAKEEEGTGTDDKAITVEKTELEVGAGATKEVMITEGSGEYTVVVSNGNAVVEIKGTSVVIDASDNEGGTAVVTVTDTKTKKTATINVKIVKAPKITFDKKYLNWRGDETNDGLVEFVYGDTSVENRSITITGGTAPYTLIPRYCYQTAKTKTTANVVNIREVEMKDYCGIYDTTKRYIGDVDGNKITFESDVEYASDKYIIEDALGKRQTIYVNVRKPLEVNKTRFELVVGETVNDLNKIRVEGLMKLVTIKSNSNSGAVEASIDEDSSNTSQRALILKGLSAGVSEIVVTDGVAEKTVEVVVKDPAPLTLYKDDATVELDDTTVYDLGKFQIKGGTKDYSVTFDGDLIQKPVEATGHYSGEYFYFELERNMNIAQGGEVTVTVTDNNNGQSKTFKVNCETLLEMTIKVNGVAIPKAESGNGAYYKIVPGMYAGYQISGINVGDIIEFTVANGSGTYTVVKDTGYGSDKIEVTENGNNTTFTVTAKLAGAYYGDVTITDTADATKKMKITRIYIQ